MKSNVILLKPIVSEKSFNLASEDKQATERQYTFEIARGANKLMVKSAVEEMFGVKVNKVNIINTRGKSVRWGKNRKKGRRSDTRKAIVSLSKGEIDVFKIA